MAVLFSRPLVSEGSWLDFLIDVVAWMTFVLGMVFRVWPTLYIGGRKRITLVSEGPYSMCRNPLYLGSFLLAASTGLFLQSPLFALFLATVVLVYVHTTIPAEERDLQSILGVAYEEYCKRVPRLWPRFSLFHTPELLEVKVKGLRIEAKRAMLWLFIPVLGELVVMLRGQTWWPHWFNIY